jgi:signal peptidase I
MLNKLYRLCLKIWNTKLVKEISELFVFLSKSQLFIFIISLVLFIEFAFIKFNFRLSINMSDSLPFRAFLIDGRKEKIVSMKRGDYIQFYNKNTKYYRGEKFTKMLLAKEGDILEIEQFEKPIENMQAIIKFWGAVLQVKDYTSLGTKLHLNNTMVIPKNKLFVIGLHNDSFDSRYQEFGLIDEEEVIGVAKPIF